ncbi:MAG: MerC domain-containing protein [Pelatocladus maniniholoensis HA4357-MV3]|uniref:MerC domain-containing protein n=1 Tax=Pelatocladus maniniholoensis HA4357-MV3 TaxID=1117104 RepID=A0A9E3LSX0_9NOST|nr:MerC domain-containing protein [Pelatocladus maniniholoensis HA4357-MV3]
MQMVMDRTAIALSTTCAIHCLFLPVLLIMLPALATTSLGSENFHRLMLWFAFPVSVLALTQGCRRHKDRIVLTAGILGLVLLTTTAVFGHTLLTEDGERITTVLGATALAFGHIRNYRICNKNKCKT